VFALLQSEALQHLEGDDDPRRPSSRESESLCQIAR
jgi:hypothetical protein